MCAKSQTCLQLNTEHQIHCQHQGRMLRKHCVHVWEHGEYVSMVCIWENKHGVHV